MTKTKLRELLYAKRIFNTYDFVGHGGVYLSRRSRSPRSCTVPCWIVNHRGFKSDPDAGWYDYGCKTFTIMSGAEAGQILELAKVWTADKYDFYAWILDPYGSWMSKYLHDQRLRELLG